MDEMVMLKITRLAREFELAGETTLSRVLTMLAQIYSKDLHYALVTMMSKFIFDHTAKMMRGEGNSASKPRGLIPMEKLLGHEPDTDA